MVGLRSRDWGKSRVSFCSQLPGCPILPYVFSGFRKALLNKVTAMEIVSTLNSHNSPGSVRPSGPQDLLSTLSRTPGLCTSVHLPWKLLPTPLPLIKFFQDSAQMPHLWGLPECSQAERAPPLPLCFHISTRAPIPQCVCHPTPDPKVCLLLMSASPAF